MTPPAPNRSAIPFAPLALASLGFPGSSPPRAPLALTLSFANGLAPHPLVTLEAGAFSPTTVRVEVNAVTGALEYNGSAVDRAANTAAGFPLLDALTLNQDSRLTLDRSFTGQDLFRVRLRSGNFGPSGFFSNPPTPLRRLDVAVNVNRAFLRVPLGSELRVTAGSRLMRLDLLPVWPSAYTASPILELFQRAGASGRCGPGRWRAIGNPRGPTGGPPSALAGGKIAAPSRATRWRASRGCAPPPGAWA